MGENKSLFRGLAADDPELETTQIESLCMECGENGMTNLLLTRIPYYKDVVLMSFACDHCGCRNNELQSGSRIEDKGVHITVNVKQPKDLNRQLVKSDFTSFTIKELDFEIPAQSQKGEVTTIEGVINRSVQGLQQDQPRRREQDPKGAEQIDAFLAKLTKLKLVEEPFTLILDDISGNSFVENLNAPSEDPDVKTKQFTRTKEQDHLLGIYDQEEIQEVTGSDNIQEATGSDNIQEATGSDTPEVEKVASGGMPTAEPFALENLDTEIFQFQTNCPNCNAPCETNMKLTNIPHFKDCLIMATNCDVCGCRTNEVKSGGGIEPTGCKLEVKVTNVEDLKRDVLKSETCSMQVPELQLDVGSNALGGRFSTVEGLMAAMKDQLLGHHASWGDSMTSESKQRYEKFLDDMNKALTAEFHFTLVLDDPAGNSYIQSLEDDGPDPALSVVRYERNFDQNEELGLNDIKTENYHEDS